MTKTNVVATLPIEPADLNAAASTTAAGIVELATSAETIAGTLTTRAVTPAGLQAKVASDEAKGIVELATDAEAMAGEDAERALTAANLRAVLTGLKFISFAGRDNVGACAAVGAMVGDLVLYVSGLSGGALGNAGDDFEAEVTVEDEIQQLASGDLSGNNYLAVLLVVAEEEEEEESGE